jgi:hypothetical protein
MRLLCDRRVKNAILMILAVQIKVRVTDIYESLSRIEGTSAVVQGVHCEPNTGLVAAVCGFSSCPLQKAEADSPTQKVLLDV